MTTTKKDFIPVLLGGDLNLYGMARSFYELTNKPIRVIASAQIAPTKYSSILDIEYVANFDTDPTFIDKMRKIAKEYENSDVPVILMGMGDWYTELISRHRDELSKTFICPYIDTKLEKELENKESFYAICEQYNLPYPKTKIITKAMVEEKAELQPYEFPVALKSANSVTWNDFKSPIKEKVYIIDNMTEYNRVIHGIYKDGYEDNMILQEFVQGDASPMRVLNVYVDKDHKVKMMCLGNAVLADPTPLGIGNYLAIIPDYNEEIFNQVKYFLEDINYTGFANFDLKYDIKDNTYKFFEINLRQGRSSFFVSLNGLNLAEWVVRDYVYDDLKDADVLLADIPDKDGKLWLNVPVDVFEKYTPESKYKEKAKQMIAEKRFGYTFYYEGDKSIKRYLLLQRMFRYYRKAFKQYGDRVGR
ncbi:carboxylate--amine ligase [Vagococcus sp.]|uniref:carboxylate--amine ligase n=1 Tax=Vagococcus sp. TaxID=1933889 RepID=UPI003FCDC463